MEHMKAVDFAIRKLQNELPQNLRYHSMEHTLAVLNSAEYLAKKEGLLGEQVQLLLTAAAFHDSGLTLSYQNHEELGCGIAEKALPQFGFTEKQIEQVKRMIMATKIPQSPNTIIEKVLCDADLDYLGGDNYGEISQSLRDELGLNGMELTEKEWLEIQIKFLKKHNYWTNFARKVLEPRKTIVLNRLQKELMAQN